MNSHNTGLEPGTAYTAAELAAEYERIHSNLDADRQQAAAQAYEKLATRLREVPNFSFDETAQAILKLKLVRHFQHTDSEDINILFDAIVETPAFIQDDRGSFARLKEVHEQKTLQKIAERRKQQAEASGHPELNPFQKLVTTSSGTYYIARLLNMSHLADESAYMRNCVGTSTSYLNRMKKGEIEIWSFRETETDTPLLTIEYNLKIKGILQIKKVNDRLLTNDDPFLKEFIEALKLLRRTATDTGQLRDYAYIAPYELRDIHVPDGHLLTERGMLTLSDYDPTENSFIFRAGSFTITPEMSLHNACKVIKIRSGLDYEPEALALRPEDITPETKVYAGPLFGGVFKARLAHIASPSGDVFSFFSVEIGGKTVEELQESIRTKGIPVSEHAWEILQNGTGTTEPLRVRLIRLQVSALGFREQPTVEAIYDRAMELGLTLPPLALPFYQHIKKHDELYDQWYQIAKKEFSQAAEGNIFYILRYSESFIESYWASPGITWSLKTEFVFQIA